MYLSAPYKDCPVNFIGKNTQKKHFGCIVWLKNLGKNHIGAIFTNLCMGCGKGRLLLLFLTLTALNLI